MEREPKTIKQWLSSPEVQELKQTPITKIVTEKFFRDPMRPIYKKPEVFYAPADGVVLYVHENIGPDQALVEVKGRKFTTRDLLDDQTYNERSLVISTFMTFYNVHTNRMPTDGYLVEEKNTQFVHTHGISMLAIENGLFTRKTFDTDGMQYLFRNQRKVITVHAPDMGGEYYMVQIADKDVPCIINWGDGQTLTQGDRFGQIRWGSEVTLVIPLDEESPNYKVKVKVLDCVKAGQTELIEMLDDELDFEKSMKKGRKELDEIAISTILGTQQHHAND
jgi:phosphatidylserine decarboxylase